MKTPWRLSVLLWMVALTCAPRAARAIPLKCADLYRALTGRKMYHPAEQVVYEIGPDDSPICSDCDYLSTNNRFPIFSDEWWRLTRRDVRKTKFKAESVDIFYSVSLPWFELANLRHDRKSTVAMLRMLMPPSDVRLSSDEIVERVSREETTFIFDVLNEAMRVLKPGGEFFVLYHITANQTFITKKVKPLEYLEHFVAFAHQVGFAVEAVKPEGVDGVDRSLEFDGLVLRKPE